jgi:hypothetical protein
MDGPGVLLLFRLIVFPAAVSQGARLVPVLTWQLFAGNVSDLQLGRAQYMNDLHISPQNVLEATISEATFTDRHALPTLNLSTIDMAPMP